MSGPMNPAPWKLTRPGNNFSLSPAEITARNDSRIKPLNNLLHYHAKTLGAVLPLLGGVVPSRGSARGEDGRPTIFGFMERAAFSYPTIFERCMLTCRASFPGAFRVWLCGQQRFRRFFHWT